MAKTNHAEQGAPRGALRTEEAADYIGCSASLLRKWRMMKADDPGDRGPPWVAVTSRFVTYQIKDLDAYLEARKRNAPQAA